MYNGIDERIRQELRKLVPSSTEIEVIADLDRGDSVWIGGCILASSPEFEVDWITRKEYDEFGPSIVHRKCK